MRVLDGDKPVSRSAKIVSVADGLVSNTRRVDFTNGSTGGRVSADQTSKYVEAKPVCFHLARWSLVGCVTVSVNFS